ncbi:hypothetical protein F4679DRAFT_595911 [Xylaria curta]|nr:hypothetical protein F4679DRAFT_595911 [Xylaria curta]
MSSSRPTPWTSLGGRTFGTATKPADSTATAEVHKEYFKITDRNAICDVCKQYCTTSIQKCCICAYKTCLQCHMDHEYHEQHILEGLGLDWSFVARCLHLRNADVAITFVEQKAEIRTSIGEWNPRENTLPGHTSSQHQPTPGSPDRRGVVPEDQIPKIPNSGCQAPLHLAHQCKVQLGSANVIDEASLGVKRSYGNNQSAASTTTCGITWNQEAFPHTDQDLFTKVLIEGGRNTIELCRIKLDNNDPSLTLYDAATSKALLKQDQWAVDNPREFRLQWSLIYKLIQEWHGDEQIQIEKEEAGDLKALEMLEVAFSFRAMSYDVPQRSFWVFWITGMRQALQQPGLD